MFAREVSVIVILTYVIAVGGFSHVIAGSVEAAFLVLSGARTLGHYMGAFLVPTLIGNVVGGVSLVAALNHSQVVAGNE